MFAHIICDVYLAFLRLESWGCTCIISRSLLVLRAGWSGPVGPGTALVCSAPLVLPANDTNPSIRVTLYYIATPLIICNMGRSST
jgi:hypothetical protein